MLMAMPGHNGNRRRGLSCLVFALLLIFAFLQIGLVVAQNPIATTSCSDNTIPYCSISLDFNLDTDPLLSATSVQFILTQNAGAGASILTTTCPGLVLQASHLSWVFPSDSRPTGEFSCTIVILKPVEDLDPEAPPNEVSLVVTYNDDDPELETNTSIPIPSFSTTAVPAPTFTCPDTTGPCVYSAKAWFLPQIASGLHLISNVAISVVGTPVCIPTPENSFMSDDAIVPQYQLTNPNPFQGKFSVPAPSDPQGITWEFFIDEDNADDYALRTANRTPIQYECSINVQRALVVTLDVNPSIQTSYFSSETAQDASSLYSSDTSVTPLYVNMDLGIDVNTAVCSDENSPVCSLQLTLNVSPVAPITTVQLPTVIVEAITALVVASQNPAAPVLNLPTPTTASPITKFDLTFAAPLTQQVKVTLSVSFTKKFSQAGPVRGDITFPFQTPPTNVLLPSPPPTAPVTIVAKVPQVVTGGFSIDPVTCAGGSKDGDEENQYQAPFTCNFFANFHSSDAPGALSQFTFTFEEQFDVLAVATSKKFTIQQSPTTWTWTVTPNTKDFPAGLQDGRIPLYLVPISPFQTGATLTLNIKITQFKTLSGQVVTPSPETAVAAPISFETKKAFTFTGVDCGNPTKTACIVKVTSDGKVLPKGVKFSYTVPPIDYELYNVADFQYDNLPSCLHSSTSLSNTGSTSFWANAPLSDNWAGCYLLFTKPKTGSTTQNLNFISDAASSSSVAASRAVPPILVNTTPYCGGTTFAEYGDKCEVAIKFNTAFSAIPLDSFKGIQLESFNNISPVWSAVIAKEIAHSLPLNPQDPPLYTPKTAFTCVADGNVPIFTLDFHDESLKKKLGLKFANPLPAGTYTGCTLTFDLRPTLFPTRVLAEFTRFRFAEIPDLFPERTAAFGFNLPDFQIGLPFVASSDRISALDSTTLSPYRFAFNSQWSAIQKITLNRAFTEAYQCFDSNQQLLLTIGAKGKGNEVVLNRDYQPPSSGEIKCEIPLFPVDGLRQFVELHYIVTLSERTAEVPANFPFRRPDISISPLTSCVGSVYCQLGVNFYIPVSSAKLYDQNHFGLVEGIKYECRSGSKVLAHFSIVPPENADPDDTTDPDDETDPDGTADMNILAGTGAPGYLLLEATTEVSDYPFQDDSDSVSCVLSIPVSKTRISTVDSVKTDLLAPGNPVPYDIVVKLPPVSRYEMITLTPQLCRVGVACQFQFRLSPEFIKDLPLVKFQVDFDGTWVRVDNNYCIFAQQGRDVVFQVISQDAFTTDLFPTCTFNVVPLNIPSDLLANPRLSIYLPVSLTDLAKIISTNAPIPFQDPEKYRVSPTMPFWDVAGISIFKTAGSSDGIAPGLALNVDENPEVVANFQNHIESVKNGQNDQGFETLSLSDELEPQSVMTTLADNSSNAVAKNQIDSLVQVTVPSEGGCIGQTTCSVKYVFQAANVIRTIRFANHFLIDHPAYSAQCLDGTTVIGNVIVSANLRYVYIRSVSDDGFPRGSCDVNYTVRGTKAALPILHRYEFMGNSFNTLDPRTTPVSSAAVSDYFTLPRFSPFIVTIHNSHIQEHSAQNFIALKLTSASTNPALVSLTELTIELLSLETLGLGRAFDISQLECMIPALDTLAVQPTCRATPYAHGLKLTFDLANSVNTPYLTIAWTAGSFSTPFTKPTFLSSLTLAYSTRFSFQSITGISDSQRDDDQVVGSGDVLEDSIETHSAITLMATTESQRVPMAPDSDYYIPSSNHLQQGPRFDPRYWAGDAVKPATLADQVNIYLATDQDPYNVMFSLGDNILVGSEIVLQMVYQNAAGLRNALAFGMTNTNADLAPNNLKIGKATPTCTFCVVLEVIGAPYTRVSVGDVTLKAVYKDAYSSYGAPDFKSYLRMAVKTHMRSYRDLPGQKPSYADLPIPYDPQVTTVYNFKYSPAFVLYNHEIAPTTHYSQASATIISTALVNQNIEFRILPANSIDTTLSDNVPLSVPEQFRSQLKDARYTYRFEGCNGWAVPSGSPNCVQETTDGVTAITCTTRATGTSPAIPTFVFKSPSKTFPRSQCTMKTTVVVSILETAPATFAQRTFTFSQRITAPPVIETMSLAFPRSAIVCNNDLEPFLSAGSPGVYSLQVPDGFFIPASTGPGYQIVPVPRTGSYASRESVNIIIGNSFAIPTPIQLSTAVVLYTKIQCPDDGRDITTTRWTFSYTPHSSGRAFGLDSLVNHSFSALRGYYILFENGRIPTQNHWFQIPLRGDFTVDPKSLHPMAYYWALNTSWRTTSTVVFSPPAHFKYPIIAPNLDTSAFGVYKAPSWDLIPSTGPDGLELKMGVQFIKTSLSIDPLDSTTIVLRISDDIDVYSASDHQFSDHWSEDRVMGIIQSIAPREDNGPIGVAPEGGLLEILLLSPFDDLLDFRQCFGATCTVFASLPFGITPSSTVTLKFQGQSLHPIQSTLVLNTSLKITEKIVLTLIQPNNVDPKNAITFQPNTFDLYDDLYTVEVTAKTVTINILRYIPANTPINFHTQVVTHQQAPARNPEVPIGWEIEHYTSAWDRTFDQQHETVVQYPPIEPKLHTVSTAVIKFSLVNGVHLNSPIKMSFTMGRDWSFGQSIIISELPLNLLTDSVQITPIATFMLTQMTQHVTIPAWRGLKIELSSNVVIPAGTEVTIQVTSSVSSSTMVIPKITLYSTGFGPDALPIEEVQIQPQIAILPAYNFQVLPASLPLPDAENPNPDSSPRLNTRNRADTLRPCRESEWCYLRINLRSQGLPLVANRKNFYLLVNLRSQTDAFNFVLSNTSNQNNFGGSTQEKYYDTSTPNGPLLYKVLSRSLSTKLDVFTLLIEPVTPTTPISHVIIPVMFAQAQLHGVVRVTMSESLATDAQTLYTDVFPGPPVHAKAWVTPPHFYYVNGGNFVGEVVSFGIAGAGPLLAAGGQRYDNNKSLTPAPRNLLLQHTWTGANAGFSTFEDIGLVTASQTENVWVTSALTPINHAYGSLVTNNIAFGATTYESFATETDRKIQFHMTVGASMSSSSSFYTRSWFKATKPLRLDNTWSLSTYSNRLIPGDYPPPGQPIIRYAPEDLIATRVDLKGFQVHKAPWIRVRPLLSTLPLTPDGNSDLISEQLTLVITQSWPKAADVDPSLPADHKFRLIATDSLTFTIPSFYRVQVGLFPCNQGFGTLEWTGTHFKLNFGTDLTAPTRDEYVCTVGIAALSAALPEVASRSAEMTRAQIYFNVQNNDDHHLPVADSSLASPIAGDLGSVQNEYLGFYMPMPIPYPKYSITLQDVSIVKQPGTLTLKVDNHFLIDSTEPGNINSPTRARALTYRPDQFPITIDTSDFGSLGNKCVSPRGVILAEVTADEVRGLQFVFTEQFTPLTLQCSIAITAGAPLVHNGATLKATGALSLINNPSAPTMEAPTTIVFTTTGTDIKPTRIRASTPYVALSGTVIKGLTTSISLTGREFRFSQPEMVQQGPTFVPMYHSLEVGVGFKFKSVLPNPADVTTLTCVTPSNIPFARVTFHFDGQNIATATPVLVGSPIPGAVPASEKGQTGVASKFTITFLNDMPTGSVWSCSFPIVPEESQNTRSPVAFMKFNSKSSSTILENNLIIQPNVKVDLGFTNGNVVSKTMSSWTFYYNSTALYYNDASYVAAPEATLGLPQPLHSFPFDGVQCWLNNLPYGRLPLSIKSASSIDTFYTVPLERYLVPTGYELNKIFCILPNLSTVTQPASNRGSFQFGRNLIKDSFSLPTVPEAALFYLQGVLNQKDPDANIMLPADKYLDLIAYEVQSVLFQVANLNMYDHVDVTTESAVWTPYVSSHCIVNPWDPATANWLLNGGPREAVDPSNFLMLRDGDSSGLVMTANVDRGQCYTFISANKIDSSHPMVPTKADCPVIDDNCYFETVSRFSAPDGAVRIIPTRIIFKPILRLTEKMFVPKSLGTIGFIEFEYSGLDSDAFIQIVLKPDDPNFRFDSEVRIMSPDGTDYIHPPGETYLFPAWNRWVDDAPSFAALQADGSDKVETSPFGAIKSFENGALTYNLHPGDDFATLKTIRIAYRGIPTLPSGQITLSISLRTTAAPDVPVEPEKLSKTVKTGVMNKIQYHHFTPIDVYTTKVNDVETKVTIPRSPGFTKEQWSAAGIDRSRPSITITPQAAEITRGPVTDFNATLTNLSPFMSAFPVIPLLDFDFLKYTNPDTPGVPDPDSLGVFSEAAARPDWHVTAPYPTSVVPLDNGFGYDMVYVNSACFNAEFSTTIPLVRIAFATLPNTREGMVDPSKVTTMSLSATFTVNPDGLTKYYRWLEANKAGVVFDLDAPQTVITKDSTGADVSTTINPKPIPYPEIVECKFGLAFIAPTTVTYRSPAGHTNSTWAPFTLDTSEDLFTGVNTGFSRGYLSRDRTWNQYWQHPRIQGAFRTMRFMAANMSPDIFRISTVGSITMELHGTPLVPGDVFFLVVRPNDNQTSAVNPQSQPYQFFAPTTGSTPTICYDNFYPNALEPAGTLQAVSPLSYQPQVGGASNTFIMTVSKASSGMFPQFSCTAAITAAAPLPFLGTISMQKMTAREYGVITQRLKPTSMVGVDPVFPQCVGNLVNFEQVRFCQYSVGFLRSPIAAGIDVSTKFDNVWEAQKPISITFSVSVSPQRFNAVLIADLREIRFSAFYGCPGFPDASFYGQLGTDSQDGILTIPLAQVSAGDTVIKCNFSSARYTNPIYRNLTFGGDVEKIKKRPTFPFKVTLKLPNPEAKNILQDAHVSTVQFRSTINERPLTATVRLPVLRSGLLRDAPKGADRTKIWSRDPYLTLAESHQLLLWFRTTMASSVLDLYENTHGLFTKLDDDDLVISGVNFDPAASTLYVDVTIKLYSDVNYNKLNLFATPFADIETWANSIRNFSNDLRLNNKVLGESLKIGSISPKNSTRVIKILRDRHIDLEMIVNKAPLFPRCDEACGGNCQPCLANDPCYESGDCRWGLYCFFNRRETGLISSPTGSYENIVIKPGLISAPGICKPLGYGLSHAQRDHVAVVRYPESAYRGYKGIGGVSEQPSLANKMQAQTETETETEVIENEAQLQAENAVAYFKIDEPSASPRQNHLLVTIVVLSAFLFSFFVTLGGL